MSWRRALPWLPMLLLFGLFARALISMSFSESLLMDDGMNATMAQSFGLGFGYASHDPEPHPFDVRVTTGPAVLVPAALVIRLSHSAYFAPMLASAILNLSLLALFCLVLTRGRKNGAQPLLAALCLATLILRGKEGGPSPFSYWFTLLGEVPGFLMLALGSLALLDDLPESAFWLCVVSAGLAPLAKLIYAFPSALLIAVVVARLLFRRAFSRALAVIAVALAPSLCWEGFKLVSLGVAGDLDNLHARWAFVNWNLQGPAVTPVTDPATFLGLRLSNLTLMLGGGAWSAACAAVALAALVAVLWPRRHPSAARRIALVLFGGGSAIAFLWLGVATSSWSRYAFTAELGLALAICFALSAIESPRWRITLAIFWLAACSAQAPEVLGTLWAPPSTPSARLAALLATTSSVARLASDPWATVGSAGHSPTWDLQYALGWVGRFGDVTRVRGQPLHHRYLVRDEFWNPDAIDWFEELAKRCDGRILWEQPPFTISQCN